MRRIPVVACLVLSVAMATNAVAGTRPVSNSAGDDSPRGGRIERIIKQIRTIVRTILPLDELNPPHP